MRGSDKGRVVMTVRAGAAVVAALAAGCSAYERAEIEVSLGPAAARRPQSALLVPDRTAGGDGFDIRLTLVSSRGGGTSRAELGLVTSALEFVGAHGRPRSVVDGLEHFARDGSWPRVVIRIDHADAREGEVWLLDRTWALRRMRCGAMLVWEGELGPVLERLAVVLRGRGGP